MKSNNLSRLIKRIIRTSLLESLGSSTYSVYSESSSSESSSFNFSTSNKRQNLKNYVIDNIDFTGYDHYEQTPESEYIQAAIKIFNEEKGWDIKNKGLKGAFIDYLRGLPNFIGIATYYTEIRNLMFALGYDEAKEMDDPEIDKLYYNELFYVFFGPRG